MSLLDSGGRYEPVSIFPEVMVIDSDGNKFTQPSTEPIEAVARFQIQGQSGTSARRSEQDNEGFSTEKVYKMRFPRSFTKEHGILGAQSKVVWKDKRWALFGDANEYNGSPALARVDYTIKRY